MRRNGELIELFPAQREFSAYGPSHRLALVVFATRRGLAGLVLDVLSPNRRPGSSARALVDADRRGVHRGAGLQTDPAKP